MWRLRNRYNLINKIINQLYGSVRTYACGSSLRTKNKTKLLGNFGNASIFKTGSVNFTLSGMKKSSTPVPALLQLPIQGTSLNENKNVLRLTFQGEETLEFPVIWLRDNCQCPSCFDKISKSRIHNQRLLQKGSPPRMVTFDNDKINITWDDGHLSEFSKEWLCQHSFAEDHQRARSKARYFSRISWNAKDFKENQNVFRRFNVRDIINDDHTLLEWLQQLASYGVAILTGAPNKSGELEKIAQRIAFIRKTHYGEEFSVVDSDNAYNVAQKKGALQLHTDLPYYNYIPGIVMLQCVQPCAEGGCNILSDGLNAASQLSSKMFRVLAETIVDWVDIGSHDKKGFYSLNREPVLCLNSFGNVIKINWSQPQRDSVFNASVEEVIQWYDAAIEFTRIIHDEANAVRFKSTAGDILTFDNTRILHGREDYSDSNRLLYGVYIDWDEIYSRIRVLQRELLKI